MLEEEVVEVVVLQRVSPPRVAVLFCGPCVVGRGTCGGVDRYCVVCVPVWVCARDPNTCIIEKELRWR